LLTKIFTNVTTRGNVFAVWLTVGFFEVNKEDVVTDGNGVQARRVWLGQELGRAENRNVRHRMFAIVDRSALQTLLTTTSQTAVTGPGSQTIQLAATSGTTNGNTWAITVGTVLAVGPTNTEKVMVTKVAGNNVTATFAKAHAAPLTITVHGNQGPPASPFNPHNRVGLVPHYAIIE
jgi:hypothetical protein